MMLRKHALWLVIRMVSIIHFDLQFFNFLMTLYYHHMHNQTPQIILFIRWSPIKRLRAQVKDFVIAHQLSLKSSLVVQLCEQ